jgi:quinol monooxygenase YgiN
MITEHAEIRVKPGTAADLIAAFPAGREILLAAGAHYALMLPGIEDPDRVLLLVGWDNVDAHMVDFRESDRFSAWRDVIGPFLGGAPTVTHLDGDISGIDAVA